MPSLMCICQICQCGRHRCPHKPQTDIMNKSDKPCTLTEYTLQFKKYQAKRRRPSFRPPQKALTHDAKMESETTNKQDFILHPVTPVPSKPMVEYKAPEGAMESSTEFKSQFLGKWAVPAQLILPPRMQHESKEPFNHTTTQSRDFVAPPVTPREVFKSKSKYEPPKNKFDAISTINSDFVDFGRVEPTQSLKPPHKSVVSTDPFDGVSCYHSAFTAPSMPERYHRPKEVYVPSGKEFNSSTTTKSHFPMHFGVKRSESMKPQQKSNNTDSPFEGTTTNLVSYKSWELPSRFSRPPTIYTPPTERFATSTTFKCDYPDYGRTPSPATSFRPPLKTREQVVPFETLTTQNLDFKAWTNILPPSAICREKKYEPPTEKFDAISTFQAHYKGTYGARSSSTKPTEKPYVRSSKMENYTSYKDSYSDSGYKPCPSATLITDRDRLPEFAYSHQDTVTGHTFFQPTVVNDSVSA